MLSLEVNEREQAPLGQRIRAVGMCFYKKGDLKKGITTSCVGIATIPKTLNVSMMCALTSLSLCNFFYYLRSLFYSSYVKNLHGPAKNSVATVLSAELRQLPISATKI